jgi:ADP-heptose:LPS heptosyltransferase
MTPPTFAIEPKRFSAKAQTLQRIDRYAGVPVCFLLTLLRRVGSLMPGRPNLGPGTDILFLKLSEQGSTVLACDAVRKAIDRVGRSRVHFLTFEENRFIVDVLGLIPPENVLTIETRSALAMAWSCLRRLREIRSRRLDACIDLEFFSRFSAAIAFLTGARKRVGFHAFHGEGPYRGDLMTHRVLYNPHLHTGSAFACLVLALDADPRRLPILPVVPSDGAALPAFHAEPAERSEVAAILAGLGMPPTGRLILMNANAGDLLPLRKWEGNNYVVLARRLLEKYPEVFIGFTGSPDEAPGIGPLVAAVGSKRCLNLVGRTTLRQLLVLYGLAEILVTNDSGPAHFAALTDIDTVVLFGPETPLLFAARGPKNHVICAGIACSPCISALNNRQTACRDNVCMQMITVDQVFSEAVKAYESRILARQPVPS